MKKELGSKKKLNKMHVEKEMLGGSKKSIILKALMVSFIVHTLIIGLTSFSLYKDWAKYGIKSPASIKELKKEEAQMLAEERRVEAAAKALATQKEKEKEAEPEEPTPSVKTTSLANTKTEGIAHKKPPEIDPLPPTDNFDIDSIDFDLE